MPKLNPTQSYLFCLGGGWEMKKRVKDRAEACRKQVNSWPQASWPRDPFWKMDHLDYEVVSDGFKMFLLKGSYIRWWEKPIQKTFFHHIFPFLLSFGNLMEECSKGEYLEWVYAIVPNERSGGLYLFSWFLVHELKWIRK